jgi:hypothetical protein
MEGGEISGNFSTANGAGVGVVGPTSASGSPAVFTMKGGEIKGNKAGYDRSGTLVAGSNRVGGGVVLVNGGTFDFQSGTITGNESSSGQGQGIYIHGSSTSNYQNPSILKLSKEAVFGVTDDILVSNTIPAKDSNTIVLYDDFLSTGSALTRISLRAKGLAASNAYITEWADPVRLILKWTSSTASPPLTRFTWGNLYSSNDFTVNIPYDAEGGAGKWTVNSTTGAVSAEASQ